MKKTILLIMLIILSVNVLGVNTCIQNQTLCFDTDMSLYETGITFYEGQNDKYNLYIENPDSGSRGWIQSITDWLFDSSNKEVNPDSFTDETTFTFDSIDDFYNLLQIKNAEGNISLYTKSDLYETEREMTSQLTSEVINWTYLLIMIIIEFFRITMDVAIILLTIFIVFRGIPMCLNFAKTMTIKFVIWSGKK